LKRLQELVLQLVAEANGAASVAECVPRFESVVFTHLAAFLGISGVATNAKGNLVLIISVFRILGTRA
jgi:hypothetical protein